MQTTYIPNELKQMGTWACYDNNKLLISALSGFSMTPTDLNSLTTYQNAYKYFEQHHKRVCGLAFVLPPDYIMVDVATKNKEIANEFLDKLPTYAEYSQTKDSIHFIIKHSFGDKTKVSLPYGISIFSKGQYVCMTGDIIIHGNDFVSHNLGNMFNTLYEKYFLGIVKQENKYVFSTSGSQNTKLDSAMVENRIALSPSNVLYYQLKSGSYQQAGFVDRIDGLKALIGILIFFASGDRELVFEMVRGTQTYERGFENKQGNSTMLDLIYNEVLQEQKEIYDADKYNPQDYIFDKETGITRHFENYSLDDTGNAKRIYDKYKDIIRYDTTQGAFYLYNQHLGCWKMEHKDNIQLKKLVDEVINDIRIEMRSPRIASDEKAQKSYLKNIAYMSCTKGKNNAIEELKHLDGIDIDHAVFDTDTYLLNTLSGVLNLKNGQLLEHNPDFYMTKSTHCTIDTKNPPELFLKFMKETCVGKQDVMGYLKRALGYSITGSIKEQCYFAMFGDGNNGKSVLMNVMSECLGDYCEHCSILTFVEQKYVDGSKATPEIARLAGARMIITSEPRDNVRLDENKIKEFTGGEPIYARALHKDGFTFRPIGKLWISCNNLLKITGTTRGDWRRYKQINFENDVPEDKIDKELFDKLKAEVPQILGYYLLQGCLEYLEKGSLQEPECIKEQIREFRTESNSVLQWATQYTAKATSYKKIPAPQFFINYLEWAKKTHENENISQNSFARELKKAFDYLYGEDVEKIKGAGGKMYYAGVQLLKDDTNYIFTNDVLDEGE